MRCHTSKSGEEHISRKEYVDCMKEGQNDIHYITGKSIAASPPPRAGPRSGPGQARVGLVMLVKLTKMHDML